MRGLLGSSRLAIVGNHAILDRLQLAADRLERRHVVVRDEVENSLNEYSPRNVSARSRTRSGSRALCTRSMRARHHAAPNPGDGR